MITRRGFLLLAAGITTMAVLRGVGLSPEDLLENEKDVIAGRIGIFGSGLVRLDADGITLNAEEGGVAGTVIKWIKPSDGTYVGQVFAFDDSGLYTATLQAGADNNNSAKLALEAWYSTSQKATLNLLTNDTNSWAQMGGDGFEGFSVSDGSTFLAEALLHLRGTAPTTLWQDSTSSAKSLLLTVDGNKGIFSEVGGAADNLLALDLANARVGIGTDSPQRLLHLKAANSSAATLVALDDTDSTDGNGSVISWRATTTGAGAADFQQLSAIQGTAVTHDHATRKGRLDFATADAGTSTNRVQIDSRGLVVVSGHALHVGSNQVIGARQTGWTAATGTPTRSSFATGSVTLPQLAERVKALIDDLMTHGAIGA